MLTNVKLGGVRCVEILCIENKAGVCASSRRRPTGVWGRIPRRCGDVTALLPKIRSFRHSL